MIVFGSGNGNLILRYICTYPGQYSGITLGAEFKVPIETTDMCCLDLYVIKVFESLGKAMCLRALIASQRTRKLVFNPSVHEGKVFRDAQPPFRFGRSYVFGMGHLTRGSRGSLSAGPQLKSALGV